MNNNTATHAPDYWTLRIDNSLPEGKFVICFVGEVSVASVMQTRGENIFKFEHTHAVSSPLVKFLRMRTVTYARAELMTASSNAVMMTQKNKYRMMNVALMSRNSWASDVIGVMNSTVLVKERAKRTNIMQCIMRFLRDAR